MTAVQSAALREAFAAYTEDGIKRIEAAFEWANNLDFSRKMGVAGILAGLNLDTGTIIACIVQQSVEADGDRMKFVPGIFGDDTARLAESAVRIAGVSSTGKTIQEAENIRKMLFAMAGDIRVIFIKLADRLWQMRQGAENDPAFNMKSTAQECLSVYAPLADRLGISWMKAELEDLALKYTNRDVFSQIKEIVALKKEERQNYLDTVTGIIRAEAAAAGIPVEVSSRAKHFYSIYRKMRKRNKSADELLDLFGIRIVCGSIENCYTLLGIVHRLWKPLDGRFKDYIAMPKSNGYRSLHTTVMVSGSLAEYAGGEIPPAPHTVEPGKPFPWSPLRAKYGEGQPMEIQIRTGEMHRVAEYGIASHWLYKKGAGAEAPRQADPGILSRLMDWKNAQTGGDEGENSGSFLEDIKRELLKDSIFVFTPQGKVVELPAGATAIDFAYAIHSAIGDHTSGAKANGSIIPLSLELQNTWVVEILTATNAHPHLNWLATVKTSKARTKIRAWLQANDPALGTEKPAAKKKETPSKPEAPAPEKPKEAAKAGQGIPESVQEVIPAAGGRTGLLQVRVKSAGGRAEKNMLIRFAGCCKPVAGDVITGYVSRGRGIIIHRKNCANLHAIPDFAERKIDAEWDASVSRLVRHFKVEARLRPGLFSEIEGAIRKHRGQLLEGRLEETSANHMTGFFTMRLDSENDLKSAVKGVRAIPAVYSIVTREL